MALEINSLSPGRRIVDEFGRPTVDFYRWLQEVVDVTTTETVLSTEVLYAELVIKNTYGDTVSAASKAKELNKFGRTANADSGVRTTVAPFQAAIVNETFVSTNLVDSVVSTDAGDTQTIKIEGHTIDASGNLTFKVQSATLTGQTEVTLGTPLARVTRAYVANSGTFNSPQAALAGTVSVYDNTDGVSGGGVPTTAAATKLVIEAAKTQSEKCSTTVSSTDYWILTGYEYSITGSGPNTEANFQKEIRDVANGGVWRPLGPEIALESGALPSASGLYRPYFIVPKNHDFRVVVTTSTANSEVTAEIQGVLAEIV